MTIQSTYSIPSPFLQHIHSFYIYLYPSCSSNKTLLRACSLCSPKKTCLVLAVELLFYQKMAKSINLLQAAESINGTIAISAKWVSHLRADIIGTQTCATIVPLLSIAHTLTNPRPILTHQSIYYSMKKKPQGHSQEQCIFISLSLIRNNRSYLTINLLFFKKKASFCLNDWLYNFFTPRRVSGENSIMPQVLKYSRGYQELGITRPHVNQASGQRTQTKIDNQRGNRSQDTLSPAFFPPSKHTLYPMHFYNTHPTPKHTSILKRREVFKIVYLHGLSHELNIKNKNKSCLSSIYNAELKMQEIRIYGVFCVDYPVFFFWWCRRYYRVFLFVCTYIVYC